MNTILNNINVILDVGILYIFLKEILRFRNKKIPTIFLILSFLLMELILWLLSLYINNDYSGWHSYIAIIVSFFSILAITFFYKSPLRHRLFVALFYQVFCSTSEYIVYYLSFILSSNAILENIILGCFCSKIILFLLVTITILLFNRKKRHYSLPYTFLLLVTPVISAIIMFCFPSAPNMTDAQAIMYTISLFGIILINFLNYFLL